MRGGKDSLRHSGRLHTLLFSAPSPTPLSGRALAREIQQKWGNREGAELGPSPGQRGVRARSSWVSGHCCGGGLPWWEGWGCYKNSFSPFPSFLCIFLFINAASEGHSVDPGVPLSWEVVCSGKCIRFGNKQPYPEFMFLLYKRS